MEDGRMKQIGITSFGLAFGCELGFHGAFTRTSKYQVLFSVTTMLELTPNVETCNKEFANWLLEYFALSQTSIRPQQSKT